MSGWEVVREIQTLAAEFRAKWDAKVQQLAAAWEIIRRDALAALEKHLREYEARRPAIEAEARAANQWLLKHRWPPPWQGPITFAHELRDHCAGMTDDEAQRVTDEAMLSLYPAEVLRTMLASWLAEPRLAHRVSIFLQGFEAHFRGEYFASISTLLPQVEGILTEWHGQQLDGYRSYEAVLAKLDEAQGDLLHGAYRSYFTIELAAKFDVGEVMPELSRHAIAHGADVQFGTEANSLRMILVLENIIELVGWDARTASPINAVAISGTEASSGSDSEAGAAGS